MGEGAHTAEPALQPQPSFRPRHGLLRLRHYAAEGVSRCRRGTPALGQSGYVVAFRASPHTGERQAGGVDHARCLAFNRHLPPYSGMPSLSVGMPTVQIPARRRFDKRPVGINMETQAEHPQGEKPHFRSLQPVACRRSRAQQAAQRAAHNGYSQPHRHTPVPPRRQG